MKIWRWSLRLAVVIFASIAVVGGCASNKPKRVETVTFPTTTVFSFEGDVETGQAELDEADASLVDLVEINLECSEVWACFGTPDEYNKEKEVVAVVIYRYKDHPTLEMIKQLKSITLNRKAIYFTEPVSENEKPKYVVRETGINGGHSIFRPIDTPTEEIGRIIDRLAEAP